MQAQLPGILTEDENWFQRIIMDAPFPIMIHAEDGEVIFINSIWTELTGYFIEDIPTISEWTKTAYGKRQKNVKSITDKIYGLDKSIYRYHEEGVSVKARCGDTHTWAFGDSPLGRLPDGRRLVLSMALDITARTRAEDALRKAEEKWRSLVYNVPAVVFTTDIKGAIEFFNATPDGGDPEAIRGKDIFDYVLPQYRQLVKSTIKHVLQTGEMETYECEVIDYPGHVAWYSTQLGPIYKDDKITGLIFIATDITERKKAEEALSAKHASLQMLQMVAVIANEATDVDSALLVILERICQYTGWPIGHVYVSTEDSSGQLRPTKLWYLEQPERFEAFRKVTEETSFDQGIGLPGRVFSTRKPAWIIDVNKDPNFLRTKLAKNLGVKSSFAFPILVGAEVAAVLEFFSAEAVEPDEQLLEIMAHVGTQLGRVIERKKANQALENKNIALKEILARIEIEKKQTQDKILANIHNVVLPNLEKIRLKGGAHKHVDMVKRNLEDITSSFGRRITEAYVKLTGREIEICNMIRDNLISKEIAGLLAISPVTIERHRANIRKKFDISNKKVNLTSFLKDL